MLNNELTGQIIISKKVYFNHDDRYHTAEWLLNEVEVLALPSVAVVSVIIKLFANYTYQELCELIVKDPKGNTCTSQLIEMKNSRQPPRIPGIEISYNLKWVVMHAGNYFVQLFEKSTSHLLAEYPLYIYVKKNEQLELNNV